MRPAWTTRGVLKGGHRVVRVSRRQLDQKPANRGQPPERPPEGQSQELLAEESGVDQIDQTSLFIVADGTRMERG